MSNVEFDQRLLSPVGKDQPCGPNLEYDPDFLQLESMIEGRPEQQYGDAIIPAEEPDWQQIERLAQQLLLRSRDLRTAACYLRALSHTRGLGGLAAGLELFASLLGYFWDELHPSLRVDGEPESLERFYSISSLANPFGFLKDLKDCALLRHQNAVFSVRDLEQAVSSGRTASGYSREQVAQIVRQAMLADPGLLSGLTTCRNALTRIETLAVQGFGGADAPDLSAVHQALAPALQVCAEFKDAAARSDHAPDSSPVAPEDLSALRPPAALTSAGMIRSRQDVEHALQQVCQYLHQHEPTNPAPLLLQRALRLMSMNFIEIVGDMAPDALRQIQVITGFPSMESS